MTDDEIRGLKTINLHLFRRGLPQVNSIQEFRQRARSQNSPTPPEPPPEASRDE